MKSLIVTLSLLSMSAFSAQYKCQVPKTEYTQPIVMDVTVDAEKPMLSIEGEPLGRRCSYETASDQEIDEAIELFKESMADNYPEEVLNWPQGQEYMNNKIKALKLMKGTEGVFCTTVDSMFGMLVNKKDPSKSVFRMEGGRASISEPTPCELQK